MEQHTWQRSLLPFLASAALLLPLAACSGGGGGGGSATTTTSTTSTTTTSTTVDGQSGTATATVTGTGTAGATSVTGISTAEKISVVGSSTSGKPAVTGLKMIDSLLGLTVTLPSSWTSAVDYYKDPQFVYTFERGDETLNTPNEILCQIAQLEADKMVNRGAYRAQIDKNKCESGRDDKGKSGTSNSGQNQGSSNAPDYEDWTVISNRASDTSPHVVSAWVHTTMGGPQGEQAAVIFAKATLAESPSSTNPYGMFTMSFKAHPEVSGAADTSTEIMHGLLRTVKLDSGKVVLQFFNAQNESKAGQSFSFSFATSLSRASDGSSGNATSSFPNFESVCGQSGCNFTGLTNTVWNMAYDATRYARAPVVNGVTDTASLVCLDKTTKVKAAWRYGLYKAADGSRKTLQSGFPIRYVDSSNASHEGYVGYWGLWINDGTSVPSGSTVKKQDWSGSTASETDYTYRKTKGRLIKHTNQKTTLDKIKNVPLSYGFNDTSTSPPSFKNYELKWDGTKFAITGEMGQNGITTASGTLPVSALQWSSTLFMYSQALGGTVIIELPVSGTTVGTTAITSTNGCTKSGGWNQSANGGQGAWTNETFDCTNALGFPALARVTYLKEDIIMPDGKLSDGTTVTVPSLTCYENCPDGSKFDASSDTGSVFYARNDNLRSATSHSYTWDQTNYLLKDGANSIAIDLSKGSTAQLNTNLTGDWGPLTWGLNTGVLFEASSTNLNLLKCPWDTGSYCTWQAQQVLPVFYTWQTGPDDWNVLTALFDTSNVAVKFDQPIHINFTYPSEATGSNPTATDTKYAGVPFRLEYGGFGDLWGIPGHCVDGESGEAVDCWNATKWVRYIPEFTIPDGVSVTDEATTANTYYVKALEVEESMTKATSCSSVTLTTLTLPTESNYVAPDIGTEPTVTDPPAVIGGVVQRTL